MKFKFIWTSLHAIETIFFEIFQFVKTRKACDNTEKAAKKYILCKNVMN